MKIYFAGPIRGGRQDAALYLEIVRQLREYGDVLTEHAANRSRENNAILGRGRPGVPGGAAPLGWLTRPQ
jgi:hypothetical protein